MELMSQAPNANGVVSNGREPPHVTQENGPDPPPVTQENESDNKKQKMDPRAMFRRVGRALYIHVDLDSIAHNCQVMRNHCRNKNVGVMAVLKSDSYGHGAVQVGRHLKVTKAAERIAVATVAEGIWLRRGGVSGPINIFGNVQEWEMKRCVLYDLIPSVSDLEAIRGMSEALRKAGFSTEPIQLSHNVPHDENRAQNQSNPRGAVHLKLDTGMSRNGCQPSDVAEILEESGKLGVPVEGIYSHFANFEDREFSMQQLHVFEDSIAPYKDTGMLFHISAAGPALHDIGTEYDFIRPGITILGQPADSNVEDFASRGFKPSLAIRSYPTLVKLIHPGTKVGYGCQYTASEDEWVGTFPIGYADGYYRFLSCNGYVHRDKTGEKCPLLGRISMDAITARLPCEPDPDETFTIVTADFDPKTSASGICLRLGTIPQEFLARLNARIPRVFTTDIIPEPEIVEALGMKDLDKFIQYQ